MLLWGLNPLMIMCGFSQTPEGNKVQKKRELKESILDETSDKY